MGHRCLQSDALVVTAVAVTAVVSSPPWECPCPCTYIRTMFTTTPRTPRVDVVLPSIFSGRKKRGAAFHDSIAVIAHASVIDNRAPSTSACLYPHVYPYKTALSASLDATSANINPPASDRMWAASVMIAKDEDRTPPPISTVMDTSAKATVCLSLRWSPAVSRTRPWPLP